ncbi:AzlC family ABC transporter permease [Paenibacillus massiliensis]|uniref:AzlC family ABC transporter permease n=1 Tax=Paenibacillus massiliensis TaxID=225917 RepID=UPI0003600D80|nr:AzlC family ABC transporter permease [Paenibacillus massiliensis]
MEQINVRSKPNMVIREDSFLQGVKDCVPTLLGYLSIGFAVGVVAKTAGLSILEIALLSLLLYAGSAQFIISGMVVASTSPTAIILTVFLVNLRHLLLSAAVSPYFRHLSAARNGLVGALLTDETFGVAMIKAAEHKKLGEKWMHGLNLTAYLNWFVATLAGAYLGQWISNPELWGLDFALTGMFIGILAVQIASRSKLLVDLIVTASAIIIAVGASVLVSGSMAIIIATVGAATVGMVISRWK